MDETARSLILAFTALALMAGVVIGAVIGQIVRR
jgi:F0F1-type ATP synthase assembly protein I